MEKSKKGDQERCCATRRKSLYGISLLTRASNSRLTIIVRHVHLVNTDGRLAHCPVPVFVFAHQGRVQTAGSPACCLFLSIYGTFPSNRCQPVFPEQLLQTCLIIAKTGAGQLFSIPSPYWNTIRHVVCNCNYREKRVNFLQFLFCPVNVR